MLLCLTSSTDRRLPFTSVTKVKVHKEFESGVPLGAGVVVYRIAKGLMLHVV